MAQGSIAKAFLAVMVVALFSIASAQEMAPAPAPDAGVAFSTPVSSTMIGASLLFSVFALLRH